MVLLAMYMPGETLAQTNAAGDDVEYEEGLADVLEEERQGPTLRVRGRIYGSFESIDPPGSAPDDSRLNDAYLRRADVTIRGLLLKDLGYYVKSEFKEGELDIRDAYLGYDAGFAVIQVGYLDPIDELVTPAYHEFFERSAVEGFPPGNQLGVGFLRESENWTFFAAAFKNTIDKYRVEEAGITYSTRFTIAPPMPEGYLLHIGGYASWREADDDEDLFRYRERSLLRTGERFVDTGAVADEETLLGVELAGNIGSTSLESQCAVIRASVPTGESSNLKGCYLSGLWNITGEARGYSDGGFSLVEIDRPVFEGGPGAWQVGARYDTIDLGDGPIQGGGQDTWTFALNWYLHEQFWITSSYSHTRLEDNDFHDDVTDGLGIRFQFLVEL